MGQITWNRDNIWKKTPSSFLFWWGGGGGRGKKLLCELGEEGGIEHGSCGERETLLSVVRHPEQHETNNKPRTPP